jgi:Protein of unknown function (DUF4031)
MSVYVDNPAWPFRGMLMCHMVADTPEELHAMADKIGMQRKWFQSFAKAKRPHYDISEPKRSLAIKHGAIEVDSERLIEICRRILADDSAWRNDPEYLDQKAADQ